LPGSRRECLMRFALGLLLCLLALPAAARWYQVEVVVFEHLDRAAEATEQWPELAALPDFGNALELVTDQPEMADEPTLAGPAMPIAFTPLGRGELRLAGVEQRLRSSGTYRPLLLAGWRQPSFGVVGAKAVYLSDLGGKRIAANMVVPGVPTAVPGTAGAAQTVPAAPGTAAIGPTALAPGLNLRAEGTVAIKVSRLLAIDVDFVYYHEGLPVRLRATRGAKLREVHYFDHPLFGVVVQVSPYVLPDVPATLEVSGEEPEDEEAAPAAPTP